MSRLGLPGNQLPVTQPQLPPVSALTAAHGARRPGRHPGGRGPRGGAGPGRGPEGRGGGPGGRGAEFPTRRVGVPSGKGATGRGGTGRAGGLAGGGRVPGGGGGVLWAPAPLAGSDDTRRTDSRRARGGAGGAPRALGSWPVRPAAPFYPSAPHPEHPERLGLRPHLPRARPSVAGSVPRCRELWSLRGEQARGEGVKWPERGARQRVRGPSAPRIERTEAAVWNARGGEGGARPPGVASLRAGDAGGPRLRGLRSPSLGEVPPGAGAERRSGEALPAPSVASRPPRAPLPGPPAPASPEASAPSCLGRVGLPALLQPAPGALSTHPDSQRCCVCVFL